MPFLVITNAEVLDAALTAARELSTEIRALADVQQRPLQPGESEAARYHQLAKLGKRLADAFATADAIFKEMGDERRAREEQQPQPTTVPSAGTRESN